MICQNCGFENEAVAKFCKNCGKLLTPEGASQNVEPTPANITMQGAKEKINEQFTNVKQEIAGVKSVSDANSIASSLGISVSQI